MKRRFIAFLFLYIILIGFAQIKIINNDKIINPKIEKLKTKVQVLKQQTASIARGTLLATKNYQLAKQIDLGFIAMKAYIDSTIEISKKIKWKYGIGLSYLAMRNLADEKLPSLYGLPWES